MRPTMRDKLNDFFWDLNDLRKRSLYLSRLFDEESNARLMAIHVELEKLEQQMQTVLDCGHSPYDGPDTVVMPQ